MTPTVVDGDAPHVTYGELVADARSHTAQAIRALVVRGSLPSPTAARDVLVLRHRLLAATAFTARAVIGVPRLDAMRAAVDRRATEQLADPDDAEAAVLAWLDALAAHEQAERRAPSADLIETSAPADHLLRATRLMRAAGELVMTNRTPDGIQLRSIADTEVAMPGLGVLSLVLRTSALTADPGPFAFVARASGLKRSTVDALAPAQTTTLEASTRALALPVFVGQANAGMHLATVGVRESSPGVEWADRVNRVRQRLQAHRQYPMSARTAADVARIALSAVAHLHEHGQGGVSEHHVNAWQDLLHRVGGLHSAGPADPVVRTQAVHLLDLLTTDHDQPFALTGAVAASLPMLAGITREVQRQLAASPDIWAPAKHAFRQPARYLHQFQRYARHYPTRTSGAIPWPTMPARAGLSLAG